MFRFKCASCGDFHSGIPDIGWSYPVYYLDVPEAQREDRCELTSDTCVIDDKWFFVRGCLEVPVIGTDEVFAWGVWVSLSESDFLKFIDLYEVEQRSQEGSFLGWFSTYIELYDNTVQLKARAHLRDHGIRPFIELEPTDHPLAVEQREGVTLERLREIYRFFRISVFPEDQPEDKTEAVLQSAGD